MSDAEKKEIRVYVRALLSAITLHGLLNNAEQYEQALPVVAVRLADELLAELERNNSHD